MAFSFYRGPLRERRLTMFFSSWLRPQRPKRRPARRRPSQLPLRLEQLEDRTVPSAVLVSDINSFPNTSSPNQAVEFNGALYFSATDGVHGLELWRSDGTEAGTVMVKDISPGG